ncbi:alkylhydroperoxidase like protein, AhpD family [mine drainage metagenome]|uniref:Alkylhydroperoxidase like protein, AhpD family n=1 Tax=mine drainage metagenome TaxID=410659 RepID=T0Y2A3_9ZZZZ
MAFLEMVERKRALDTKTKELIALAAGLVKHCEWCIAYYVKGSNDAGATKEEIFEAA